MDTFRDLQARLKWILDTGDIPAREVSRAAKFPSESHVGMVARGDVADPKVGTAEAIAEALGLQPGWLAFGEGDPPSEAFVREIGARFKAAREAAKAAKTEAA